MTLFLPSPAGGPTRPCRCRSLLLLGCLLAALPAAPAVRGANSYHVGLDFIDTPTPSPASFFFDFDPFPLTAPSNYFVTQGAFDGWTEDDARRAVALAVEDVYRDIATQDPEKMVAINLYLGLAPTDVSGTRMHAALGQPSGGDMTLLGETGSTYNNPFSEDNYVTATYLHNIDGLGNGLITYDTAEGAINSIAGTTAHEIGHVFTADHVSTSPGDPHPLPLMAVFDSGLAWEDRLLERRLSTTLPMPQANAELVHNSAGLALKADLDLDGVVNAVDASVMFANWGLDDRLHHEGDASGDHWVNAADAGEMFAQWTGDPGPAPGGSAKAEYDPNTGQVIVSVAGVVNWYVESASLGLTGDSPANLPQFGGAVSDNDQIVGETTGFIAMTYTDVNLGNIGGYNLPAGDLTIRWNQSLGGALESIPVEYLPLVPEPSALALAAIGLCGMLATRRRRMA